MNIDYFSDVHVNHWVRGKGTSSWEKNTKNFILDLDGIGKGDVCVFAGDFSEYNVQSVWVLEVLSELYDKVFYVLGNHDYYVISNKYTDSIQRVLELFRNTQHLDNVSCLNNAVEDYKGKIFAGCTLWYDLDSNSPMDMYYFSQIADKRYIKLDGDDKPYEFLSGIDLSFYNSLQDKHIDVMITHLPPTHPDISDYPPHPCFYRDVPFTVGSNWVFGHQHLKGSFEKLGTQFYVNDVGYPHENFKLDHKIEQFTI